VDSTKNQRYDTDLVKIMDEWCEQAREALAPYTPEDE
jgi:hypothetical protein